MRNVFYHSNIVSLIDSQALKIKQKITEKLADWSWQDSYVCTSPGGSVFLNFFHPTLLFHTGENKEDGCFIWYRLAIESKVYSEVDLKLILEQILETIELKPFYDQDAGGNGKIFVTKNKEMPGYLIVSCFVNPDFPKGYWENHVLPSKE